MASAFKRVCIWASASASRRAVKAASICPLAALIRAPCALRASGSSLPRPFICSVIWPVQNGTPMPQRDGSLEYQPLQTSSLEIVPFRLHGTDRYPCRGERSDQFGLAVIPGLRLAGLPER